MRNLTDNSGLNYRVIKKEFRNGEKLAVCVVDYLDEMGVKKQKSKVTGYTWTQYTRGKKKECDEMAAKLAKEVAKQLRVSYAEDIAKKDITVLQYLDMYQADRKGSVVYDHWKCGFNYINRFRGFLSTVLQRKDMPLRLFGAAYLKKFYNDFLPNLTTPKGEPISANTVCHFMNYFNRAFRKAYKTDYIDTDICKNVEKPKIETTEAGWLKESDAIKLVNMEFRNRLDAICVLDMQMCLRRSELLGLKHKDFDYSANSVFVQRKVLFHGEFEVTNTMKTKRSTRKLPITPQICAILKWLEDDTVRNRAVLGNKYNEEWAEFVCVDESGKLYNPNRLTKHIHNLCNYLGIEDIHFHGLRHTGASMLLRAGVDIKIIQLILGHSNLGTTSDIYSHGEFSHLQEAFNIRDQRLDKQKADNAPIANDTDINDLTIAKLLKNEKDE